jgi:hypothetical protein
MRQIYSILISSVAVCLLAFGQPAKDSVNPRAVLVKPLGARPYLRVDDCIRRLPCRQLGREEPVPVNDGFMFFSILSTGVDVKTHHRIVLKIAGFAIPDTIGVLVREAAGTQRIYFFVDLHRYPQIPLANHGNIDVWVDGKIITTRVE